MTNLTCPKCRQAITDSALDAEHCPSCGFVIDGPVVLGAGQSSGLALAVGGALVVAAGLVAGYLYFPRTEAPSTTAGASSEVAAVQPVESAPVPVAPIPPELKQPKTLDVNQLPIVTLPVPPTDPPKIGPGAVPAVSPPKPAPIAVEPQPQPKKPRVFDLKIEPQRPFPFQLREDTAMLPDLRSEDKVTLTGNVRVLKIGSVNGKASLDASGLEVEEVIIGGDLNGSAVVKLNAPKGKVTINGFVMGSAKLIVNAPEGEVTVTANSARLDNGSEMTVTAKRLDIRGPMLGGAKLNATLTAGGSLKFALLDGGAQVTYRRAAQTDPPLVVEKGEIRGGAKFVAE